MTDRRTDGRTDRRTEISSLRPRCIPCSAVKTRGDTRSHPESARATPGAPVQRASSELSLNLTILLDDEVTGVVGHGHPTGERPSRPSGNVLEGQGQVAAGIKPVSEPVQQSPDTGKSERITAESLRDVRGDATVGTAGNP